MNPAAARARALRALARRTFPPEETIEHPWVPAHWCTVDGLGLSANDTEGRRAVTQLVREGLAVRSRAPHGWVFYAITDRGRAVARTEFGDDALARVENGAIVQGLREGEAAIRGHARRARA